MTKPIVSDAGPLITFARAEQLDLLRQVVGRLLIPDAVHHEVAVKGAGKPGAVEVQEAEWVERQALSDRTPAAQLRASLGKGEKEAIALCRELGAYLLADDPVARREARARRIALISTLDILDEAKVRGMISDVRRTLDGLIRSGFRLKLRLYEAKLREAGEQP